MSILQAEERRVESGEADAKMDADGNITVSKRISGDQDGDATLFGGVLTSHADRLFEMLHSKSAAIRMSTLELLGLLLRQGLVNPNEAVPHLFALQGDVENQKIRSLALRLLMAEGEKRPDTLRQRICTGVKQAYKFQRSVYPRKAQVSAVVKKGKAEFCTLFDEVFKECIASNRKQRLSLFRSLLGLFDLEESISRRNSKPNKATKPTPKDLALLSFAAQILAHLPYTTAGDPLYVVHSISSILTLQGFQTLDKFADFLRPYGLSSSDALEEANIEEEDALEVAARSKFPSRTQQAQPLSSKQFDMSGFVDLCHDGAALTLLLRLKSFLMEEYKISNSRLLEFDPSAKERTQPITAKREGHFDGSLDALWTSGTATNKDALIRGYAELRVLFRAENSMTDTSLRGSGDDDAEEAEEDDDDEEEGTESPSKRPRSGSEESSV